MTVARKGVVTVAREGVVTSISQMQPNNFVRMFFTSLRMPSNAIHFTSTVSRCHIQAAIFSHPATLPLYLEPLQNIIQQLEEQHEKEKQGKYLTFYESEVLNIFNTVT